MDYVEEHFLSLYDIVLVQNTLGSSQNITCKVKLRFDSARLKETKTTRCFLHWRSHKNENFQLTAIEIKDKK